MTEFTQYISVATKKEDVGAKHFLVSFFAQE